MRWRKRGLVWAPQGDQPWARSHASIPTPVRMDDGGLRVYVGCLDDKGRGRPTYVDLDPQDPTKVLREAGRPLLDIGAPGSFDDNGLLVTSVVRTGPKRFHLYYAGFELCTQVRYRLFTGLAVSTDGGESFSRHSQAPVLDRSDAERLFRCGAFVALEDGVFKLWYIAGSSFTPVQGKELPVYELRTQQSADGIHWAPEGRVSMTFANEDEHGFGRPWVLKEGAAYRLHYSIRRRSVGAYRLGTATSKDGQAWSREDAALGLDVSPGAFDGQAIMYSAVIESGGKTWCFYNGDDFGKAGFAVAELEA